VGWGLGGGGCVFVLILVISILTCINVCLVGSVHVDREFYDGKLGELRVGNDGWKPTKSRPAGPCVFLHVHTHRRLCIDERGDGGSHRKFFKGVAGGKSQNCLR
jgi:hypothetical protein